MLKRVSIREARAELSLLMKEVARGAEIIITNRGKATFLESEESASSDPRRHGTAIFRRGQEQWKRHIV